jgi:hypothetical protein
MRIDLRVSARFRLLLVLFIALALLMVAAALVAIGEAVGSGDVTDSLPALFSLLFFGLAALVFIRRLTRPSGAIEIRPDGVSLCCYSVGPYSGLFGGYLAVGFADWSNLSAIGLVKAQGRQCLGVRLHDLDAFTAGRAKLSDKDRMYADFLGAQSMRIIRALGPSIPIVGKFMELFMTVFGFTGMPKSAEEKDILVWNQNNYGWHLIVPDFIIPNGPEPARRVIEQHRPVVSGGVELTVDYHPDTVAAVTTSHRSAESRLIELDELFRKGLITAEEHQLKRREIIARI